MNQYTEAELFELAIQDEHILEFARGYYGLSLYDDAEAELSNASLFTRSRTDFLELRGQRRPQPQFLVRALETVPLEKAFPIKFDRFGGRTSPTVRTGCMAVLTTNPQAGFVVA